MYQCPEEDEDEEQQPRPRTRWPAILGLLVLAVALLGVFAVFAWKVGWLSAVNPFSRWSAPVEISIQPNPSSGEALPPETYKWSFDGRPWELTMEIPEDLYLYYSGMERAPVEDYSIYVTHPKDDEAIIEPLAVNLKAQAVKQGYDAEETVNFAASFVQSIKYWEDPRGEEYPNYPVETLVKKEGDCEDTAILTAALLQAMGYDAVLIRFSPPTEDESGHMAVGVAVSGVSGGRSYYYGGNTYYYLETTAASWSVGQMPDEVLSKYDGVADAIYPLAPAPALRFTDFAWTVESRWFAGTTVDLKVTVTNWGTADADDFYVRAYFEGDEKSAKTSATYDLAYGHQLSGVATKDIALPSGGGTLRVELHQDGKLVDDWSRFIS